MADNQLDKATSPYLLQHKDNPVHWMEWGQAALDRAAAEDKPILLSIGYAACHWCHVMAHESFEDAATAAVMNDLYVSVKVDREERPDVDHIYMNALHALGEQGGWPLTMFLASDGKPFWGGTYFPKVSRYGRPSFTTVLTNIAAAYHSQPERIAQNKEALLDAAATPRNYDATGPLTPAVLDEAARRALAAIDLVAGGLNGAPKFPNPTILELLFRGGLRLNDKRMLDAALLSLVRMSQGGIYDHLGGGYARYSTDAEWLVPHFEKMLYDSAQLIELLAFAHAVTGHDLFRRRVGETIAWLKREMTSPEGAFMASLDADSEGVEGRFYIWTVAEIETVLGAEDAAFFARHYDVKRDGNWHDEATGEPVTILNQLRGPNASAEDVARLTALRARLLERRASRVRPGLDDKILSDWNGLAIAAMARAATLLGEKGWLDQARRAFEAVVAHMSAGPDGSRLVHAWRQDRVGSVAFALDYAAMIGAALALHEAVLGRDSVAAARYLAQAVAWSAELDAHFALPGGMVAMTRDDAADILVRPAPTLDEAVPNANGVYAAALIRLAALTGDEAYRTRADAILEQCGPAMMSHSLAHGSLFNALDLRLNGLEVALAGAAVEDLLEAARKTLPLNRTILMADRESASSNPVLAAQIGAAGTGAAFVCRGTECSPPIRDAAALTKALGSSKASAGSA